MEKNKVESTGQPALDLVNLAAFADYLLKEKLPEFNKYMLEASKEVDIPIMKLLSNLSEEQLLELSIQGTAEMLEYFSQNHVSQFIDLSVKRWLENELPVLQSDDIVAKDISSISYLRRKAFRTFLPDYCSDIRKCLSVMEDVDRFTIELEEICYNTLFEMQKKKIREHHHFLDKINNTSPGIIYVFDLEEQKEIYSNHKREDLLGYTDADMKEMGSNVLGKILHPEDLTAVMEHLNKLATISDNEMLTSEYRVKHSDGHYIWMRVYETIFKRNEAGNPSQIIGISIDVTKEKEISQQLEYGEQQLQEAQELAGLGSFDWDLVSNNSMNSPQLIKILELDPKEKFNYNAFMENVHPSDRQKVKDALERAMVDSMYECEYRYRKSKEKVIWSRGVVAFREGKPFRMKGTVMDITQRHDMLKRLERSEELHKQAQALTHLGNWSWYIEDNKISWSDEMFRIYGLKPQSEEITFERFLSLIHPDDRQNRLAEIQRALETHKAEDYTMRIITATGKEKVLQGKGEVLLDEDNKPYKLVGTCQDVTRQYLLHEQLKENEQTFRELINNAPDAIVVIDADSNIILWNPKAEQVFGWKEEDILGKKLADTIIPAESRVRDLLGMEKYHETGKIELLKKTIEIKALNSQGKEFYIALSISQSVRAGKQVFITFIRDISSEKQSELELARHRNELTQKNRELELSNQQLTSFNYIASHDLQEPLRKIRIYSNRIIEKNASILPEETRDFLTRIMNSAEHMQQLIDDLLAFSRTTSTDQIVEETDLNELLEDIIVTLKHAIDEKNATITADPLPVLNVIPFQFQQLLENIINNAIKYSRPGVAPEVKINYSIVQAAELPEKEKAKAQSYHKITIADNGIGFDQQYATKIFELFQRLHGKNEYSGTGIGLAICKKIVDNHKGFIYAESTEGDGSTFIIYIPA